jgi:hypothetical protein
MELETDLETYPVLDLDPDMDPYMDPDVDPATDPATYLDTDPKWIQIWKPIWIWKLIQIWKRIHIHFQKL